MSDYYNDFDPGAAAWLRELIAGAHIPTGRVDDRSILDVAAADLAGFRRVHFFAGIGGWAEALRLADWPEWMPVWTGSPPCQPFSAAGKRAGRDDARHLGPRFVDLVGACRPPMLFGEQVASADAIGRAAKPGKRGAATEPEWAWWDDLSLRLETAGYAAWAGVVPAAAVGAPHIRERLFFGAVDLRFAAGGLGDGIGTGLEGHGRDGDERHEPRRKRADAPRPAAPAGATCGLADAGRAGDECGGRPGEASAAQGPAGSEARQRQRGGFAYRAGSASGRMADSDSQGRGWDAQLHTGRGANPGERRDDHDGCGASRRVADNARGGRRKERADIGGRSVGDLSERVAAGSGASGGDYRPGPTNGFWGSADWLLCRDGKWRPVEPGTFPLAHGVSGRVGLLRGYGNAIVPQAAAEFIDASREILIETGIWDALREAQA